MEIKINDDQLKAALSEALLLSIPEEARQQMIQQAIENLVSPKKDRYGKSEPSEIQEIFERTVAFTIGEIVREEIQKMPIKEDILKILEPYKYQDYDRQRVIMQAIAEALLDYYSK